MAIHQSGPFVVVANAGSFVHNGPLRPFWAIIVYTQIGPVRIGPQKIEFGSWVSYSNAIMPNRVKNILGSSNYL